MAIEIFYLTTQIQRWINLRVANHLSAQATKLSRREMPASKAGVVAFSAGNAKPSGVGRRGLDVEDFYGSEEDAQLPDAQTATADRREHAVHA